ncbi:MAG: transcription elongation factor GreA [Patescibacteria group bacterium]
MTQYLSQEGLEKLKKELEERETTLRPDIAKRILEAKELGDLSENAEYAEAREAQGMNEGRIEELKDLLKHAVVIAPHHKQKNVAIGSTVSVKFGGTTKQFTIVGPAESNPAQGFISNESPLGIAFMGKEKGEEVEAHIPSGTVKYKILEVT